MVLMEVPIINKEGRGGTLVDPLCHFNSLLIAPYIGFSQREMTKKTYFDLYQTPGKPYSFHPDHCHPKHFFKYTDSLM